MKKRLDAILVERGLAPSLESASRLVLSGVVWSAENRLEKPGMQISSDLVLEVRSETLPFVSRAGSKLDHALQTFGISVKDRVCLDIGCSTGGFTDCLLKRNARHVFAVDVGYGQIDLNLRKDERVTLLERTNARYLKHSQLLDLQGLAGVLDFICFDVSFISLKKLVEPLSKEFPEIKDWVFLFKPQFEVASKDLMKGGIVKNSEVAEKALEGFHHWILGLGFERAHGPETSPIAGKKSGNLEYLVHYEKTSR